MLNSNIYTCRTLDNPSVYVTQKYQTITREEKTKQKNGGATKDNENRTITEDELVAFHQALQHS